MNLVLEIKTNRPLTERERQDLGLALHVQCEDYGGAETGLYIYDMRERTRAMTVMIRALEEAEGRLVRPGDEPTRKRVNDALWAAKGIFKKEDT